MPTPTSRSCPTRTTTTTTRRAARNPSPRGRRGRTTRNPSPPGRRARSRSRCRDREGTRRRRGRAKSRSPRASWSPRSTAARTTPISCEHASPSRSLPRSRRTKSGRVRLLPAIRDVDPHARFASHRLLLRRYKGRAGADCAYVAANGRCEKLHDGERVGVVSCPKSCGVEEECEARRKDANAAAEAAEEAGGGGGEGGGAEDAAGEGAVDEDPDEGDLAGEEDPAMVVVSEDAPNEGEAMSPDEGLPDESKGVEAMVVEVPCEDDPNFLYKDVEGYDCKYIAKYKPEKCQRLHDGETVGAVSCPRSCDMVEECKALHNASGVVMDLDSADSVDGGKEGYGKEDGKGDDPDGSVAPVESVEEGGAEAGGASDGAEASAGGTCVDDPKFLYKDAEGWDCAYIGKNAPQKCAKLHDGEKVGVVSCPVACGMVEECEARQGAGGAAEGGDGDDGDGTTDGAASGTEVGEGEASADALPETAVGAANGTAATCKDDPKFLYKDAAGWDCAYIGKNAPQKCAKLHDGEKVGVVSCPVACGMVEECEARQGTSGAAEAGSDDGASSTVGGVAGAGSDSIASVPETADEVAANGDASEVAVPGVEESSADSDNEPPVASTYVASCKDDPDFLYKDKEGFTCSYLGKEKPQNCVKLHSGVMIGLKSCPESCDMVKQCRFASAAGGTTGPAVALSSDDVSPAEDGTNKAVAETNIEYDGGSLTAPEDAPGSSQGVEESGKTNAEEIGDSTNADGWSTDSTDEAPATLSETRKSVCKDSPDFLYKDREGYTCEFLGASAPEKCLKLHLGVEIGLSSCPESCDMVGKCLEKNGLTPEKVGGAASEDFASGGSADSIPGAVPALLSDDGAYNKGGVVPGMGPGSDGSNDSALKSPGEEEGSKMTANESMVSGGSADASYDTLYPKDKTTMPFEGTKSMADAIAQKEHSSVDEDDG
ncbi:hypothetical protein ACHAWF_015674, partial [Thalassiosira exigua]